MNSTTRSILTDEAPKLKKARARDIALAIIMAFCALLVVTLNLTEVSSVSNNSYVRLISVLPVVTISYFFGVLPGLLAASMFGVVFLIEIPWQFYQVGYSISSFELIGLTLLLLIFALLVGDISTSFRQRITLRTTIQASETLLSRTLNLDEVTYYLIDQVRQIVRIDRAYLILRSPISGQWQVHSARGRFALHQENEPANSNTNLGEFLLFQSEPVILNNLDSDESILVQDSLDEGAVNSIATLILLHTNGTDMGRLVLVNKIFGYFNKEDLNHLSDLVSAGEKAIEHAYQFARTDYALERQLSQLSAIQHASQELNATLDPERAVDLTLSVALEITQANSGVILLNMKDLIKLLRTRGSDESSTQLKEKLEAALNTDAFDQLKSKDLKLPFLFKRSASQLSVFIRHGSNIFGLIVVESEQMDTFDQTTEWVLSLLADHAAISLANARLFQEIMKEKQQTSLIIHSITDGLLTINQDGTVISANPAAQNQVGLSEIEIIGKDLGVVLGLESQVYEQWHEKVQEAWIKQQPFQLDMISILSRQRKNRIINLAAAPVYEYGREPFGMVVLMHDLTEREELNRLQEELISSMSHEMRTPLAKIHSIAELVSGSLDDKIEVKSRRYLDTLVTESERLSHFLDRVLNVHELENQETQVELRPIPLVFLVENLVEEWRIIAPERNFILTKTSLPAWVEADENGLHSVLSNLLENATKYSPEGSDIEVKIDIDGQKNVQVSVIDQGSGIPKEFQERIFERFFRVSGEDSQMVYGHGIGLYVAKILMTEMGGHIWVESEPGKGSCFTFTLPLQEEVTNET